MVIDSELANYLREKGVTKAAWSDDGAPLNPVKFPIAGLETQGAILFADLPGYSELSQRLEPMECAYLTSHFFAWFEGSAGRVYGGIVDKFIGDEVMVVFVPSAEGLGTLDAALQTARAMLTEDHFGFDPKMGIAAGPLAIAWVGTERTCVASAMGNTINLAARCCANTKGRHSIRVATSDVQRVKSVFKDDRWRVSPPEQFTPKNMAPVQVVDVERLTEWIPNFDYLEQVKQTVKQARAMGAICEERRSANSP